MATPTRRRLRVEGITSNLHALRAEPALHLGLDLLELLFCSRLEAHDKNGLSVGCPDQSPSVPEEHAQASDGNDLILAAEVLLGLSDDAEFLGISALDPDRRRRDESRNVGQRLANGFAGVGDDVKQSRRSVKRIVESVESFGEEHVPRHFTADGRVSLVHLFFDQRMPGLPHHGNTAGFFHRLGKRLGSFYIENYRLALAGALQHVARIDDKQVVAPDNLAAVIDDADTVRVTVKRNTDIGAILLYRADECFHVFWNGRIGVVIGKRSKKRGS